MALVAQQHRRSAATVKKQCICFMQPAVTPLAPDLLVTLLADLQVALYLRPYRAAFGVAIVAVRTAAVPPPSCHVATAILSAPAAAASIWLRPVGGLGSPGKLVKRQHPADAHQPSWRTTRPPAASIWSSGPSDEAGLHKGVF